MGALIEWDGQRRWALEGLLGEVRRQIQTANFSTILRAVWTLEKRSLVDRVDLGDGKARYEAPRDHHEHVRCIRCGSIAEVPGCVVDEAAAGGEARTGSAGQRPQRDFGARCPACRAVAAARGRWGGARRL